MTVGYDPLMPDMSRLVHQSQAHLFVQLTAKGFQRGLSRFDATAGGGPHDHALWQVEPAEKHAIHSVQHQRANRVSESGVRHKQKANDFVG